MKVFAGGHVVSYKMLETINCDLEIDAYSIIGRKLVNIQGA